MCAAAATGNIKRLKSYLLAKADVSEFDMSGRTPLHFAVLHSHRDTIKFLADEGANARCVDMLGQTAQDLEDSLKIAISKLST